MTQDITLNKGHTRAILVLFFSLLFSVLLAVVAAPASALNLELEDEISEGLPTSPSPGDTGTNDPRTGGSTRTERVVERCGSILNPPSWSGGRFVQYCSKLDVDYWAVPTDGALESYAERSATTVDVIAAVQCAPNGLSGGREGNGQTLVGMRTERTLNWTNFYVLSNPGAATNYTYVGTQYDTEEQMWSDLSIDCIYQNWSEETVNQICIVAIDIGFNKTEGTNNLGNVVNRRATTPWGRGDTSLSACRNSNNLNASLGTTLSEFGRYSGNTRAHFQEVTVRTYSNAPAGHARPADVITHIGPVKSRPGPRIFAQVTCDPAHTRASTSSSAAYTGGPWSWTWSDCPPDGPNTPNTAPGAEAYQCLNVDSATVNGRSGVTKATIFRDGDDNTISWNNPRVSASNLVSSTPKDTKVRRTGTPWNTPRQMPRGNNNVTLHTTSGTNVLANGESWMNGLRADYVLTANWASNAGDPTTITPTWRYDSVLNTRGIRLDSISASFNRNSGTWTIRTNHSNVTVPIRSTATCTGSVDIEAVRAINDSRG